jgi:condensin complex subunit 2
MSGLDSAFDIDPLFHKMSKSFDEGGARGLLLGNLGVSQRGCRIIFDSKEDEDGDDPEGGAEGGGGSAAAPSSWNEREIDVTKLASKLASTLLASGHRNPATVPFVPQLENLRREYAALEEEGYGVDERDTGDATAKAGGRKRLRLYDAP